MCFYGVWCQAEWSGIACAIPQLWLQTFAPNTSTPIHHHDHEEIFWVLQGSGVATYRDNHSGAVHHQVLSTNSTLAIRPHVVHQVGGLQKNVSKHAHPQSIFHRYETPANRVICKWLLVSSRLRACLCMQTGLVGLEF